LLSFIFEETFEKTFEEIFEKTFEETFEETFEKILYLPISLGERKKDMFLKRIPKG
tara:strand:+ start:1214 stop:1381 length:168 start_codon:yes stop_codon:yes gene_type:complete